jgi:O-antigen ligase
MDPRLASLFVALGVTLLFWLDRDQEGRTSPALWIPVLWLALLSSRTISQWLGLSPISSASSDQLVDGSPLDAAGYLVLLAANVVVLFRRRDRFALFVRANWPLALFLLYCGASVLWSDFPFVAFKRWIKAVGDFLMILTVLTDGEPVLALKRLLARVGFVLIPVSILLIKYYPTLGREYSAWTGTAYNLGVATGKNSLGNMTLVFGLATAWRLSQALQGDENSRKPRSLLAQGILLVLILGLFLMANSATAFVCFLMGTVLIAVASLRASAWRPVVHMLVTVMLFVVVYGLLIDPQAGLAEMAGRDATLTGRTLLWNQVLSLRVDPLFGAGYESFWLGDRIEKLWQMNWWHPIQAHNGYLQVYLDLGWVGVGFIAFLMLWGYANIARALRLSLATAQLRVAFFFIAAVYNLTEHGFRQLHPVWVAFLLAIIAVPTTLVHEHQATATSTQPSDALIYPSPQPSCEVTSEAC